MKTSAMSRSAVLCWSMIIVAGIVALAFIAPIIAAMIFLALTTVAAIAIGRKEGGWRGFVAFAKDIIFGW